MACKNCFNNCDQITSDKCIQYTGPDIPAFGICQGDQLSSIEAVLLEELQGALEGTGILPEMVTLENCPFLLEQFAGKEPNLSNLLQLLIDSSCTLKQLIDLINAQLAKQNATFNVLCLTGLPDNPTSADILQSVINKLCVIAATVAAFPTTYVKSSDLNTLVQNQITIYMNQQTASAIQYYTYLPLKVAMPYFGDLSNFDLTGKGLAPNGMLNLYLCNGLNGTPDLRGRVLVGAIRNLPGGAIDGAVNPLTVGNPNWALNDKAGETNHKLTILEIPSHNHGVTDPGHKHSYNYPTADKFSGNNYDAAKAAVPVSQDTSLTATGISIGFTGGGQNHNNIQPSIACYWIIRMV